MDYSIITEGDDVTIIVEDGGIATIHSNGDHLVTTYYQNKIKSFFALAEGKQYAKDWEENNINDTIILDALNWLHPNLQPNEFNKVEPTPIMRKMISAI